MLTLEQIEKVSRLMSQVGELRPGFLHAESSNLQGSPSPRRSSARVARIRRGTRESDPQASAKTAKRFR